MDSDAQLQAILADSFARAIAEAEDTAFTIGTGHTYSQPAGVAVNASISTVNLDTADVITTDDMLDVEYELPAQYLAGAAWLMNRKTEKVVRMFRPAVNSGYYGNYMWQPSLLVGQPNSFDSFPIYNQADMNYPADSVALKNEVIFGNFKAGYRIIDRMGITLQRLDELYAEAGLVGFKVHKRTGGGVIRTDAFRALINPS
jgi:HK97 family phage major capsid protein